MTSGFQLEDYYFLFEKMRLWLGRIESKMKVIIQSLNRNFKNTEKQI